MTLIILLIFLIASIGMTVFLYFGITKYCENWPRFYSILALYAVISLTVINAFMLFCILKEFC